MDGAAEKSGLQVSRTDIESEALPLYQDVDQSRADRRHDRPRKITVIAAIALLTWALLFIAPDALAHLCHALHARLTDGTRRRVPSGTRNRAYIVEAMHGAVASENEICSDIGVHTMRQGGNAVDAAVSTTLCIGVVNMFSYVVPPLTASIQLSISGAQIRHRRRRVYDRTRTTYLAQRVFGSVDDRLSRDGPGCFEHDYVH